MSDLLNKLKTRNRKYLKKVLDSAYEVGVLRSKVEELESENERLHEINKGLLKKRTDLELETFRLKDERKALQEDNDHQRKVKVVYREKIIELSDCLKEIKSISSMWDMRHPEDDTGYSNITELTKKALEKSK
jgi:chromosome segregation ATPase